MRGDRSNTLKAPTLAVSDRKAPSNGHDVTAPLPSGLEASIPLTRGPHELPARFSSSPNPTARPRARRRPHRGLVIGVLGGAAVIAALGITQLSANLGYDAAADRFADTLRTAPTRAPSLCTRSMGMVHVSRLGTAGALLALSCVAASFPASRW